MILVYCQNKGLVCFLSSYYAYEVNNNLILFNKNIKADKIITINNYEDYQSVINKIDSVINKIDSIIK